MRRRVDTSTQSGVVESRIMKFTIQDNISWGCDMIKATTKGYQLRNQGLDVQV